MEQTSTFAELLEAADQLSLEEQQMLIDILRRRIAERGRKLLVEDVQEARQEFSEGRLSPASVEEIMKDVLS